MSFISRWILLNVFTALLPPTDPNEEDYYSRLGLDRNQKVTADDIRKAFRKQSLKWHPDKIAQRGGAEGGLSPAEAAAKFRDIQEAYKVLSDPESRKEFHYWNCSVVRYQFVHTTASPAAVYRNLVHARFRDKARLIMAVSVLIIILLLPFLLVASAVNQTLEDDGGLADASWAALLIPVWLVFALSFGFVGLAMAVAKTVTLSNIVGLLERASWLSALVILVQIWDGDRDVDNWQLAGTPFYFAASFRILGQIIWMATVQEEMNKMISVEHLQKVEAEMLAGTSLEDLTEEELQTLHTRYHVVNPDPMQLVAALEILKSQDIDLQAEGQEEELEAVRVQCSPEYQAASEHLADARNTAWYILLFGFPMIPLTAAKLNGDIDASWWAVIMPLWVYWAVRMTRVCTLCLGYTGGDDVVVVKAGGHSDGDNSDEEDATAPKLVSPDPELSNCAPPQKAEAKTVPLVPVTPEVSLVSSDPMPPSTNLVDDVSEVEVVPAMEDDVAAAAIVEENEQSAALPSDEDIPNYASGEEDAASEAPSDEGAWQSTLPKDPPGVGPDDKELHRLEMERRKKLLGDAQEPPIAPAPSPASTEAPVRPSVATPPDTGVQSNVEDNADQPQLDEDMFRHWQKMQEEADTSAMKAQAKAQGLCCTTLFQILMGCLIVGKLEQDYPRPADGSVGYSAYWIIFPILLFAGIILCCCTIMIFASADPDALHQDGGSGVSGDESQREQEESHNSGGTPGIVVPPPPTLADIEADVEAPAPAPPEPVAVPTDEDDLNELD